MKANERLRNVIKIGYLDTSSNTSKVQPELNSINIDNTDYEVHNYKSRQREASEERRTKELFKEFSQEHKNDNIEVAGFWESYFHYLGMGIKFIGKIVLFCIGFGMTVWIWNMIF